MAAHLDRIEALNPSLNAVVTINESARSEAEAADADLAEGVLRGPLHGVPVTVKDCFEAKGLPTTAGHPSLRNHRPGDDAGVVARLRAAGAILLGKTNLSRLAADWQTENPVFGRTRNPWNPRCTSGGSSGGSAVAVAVGMSPLDVGTDLGGSIRVPAHFCGVLGLKTSEHRVPSSGVIPDGGIPGRRTTGIHHQSVCGPLARSLDDLALALGLIAGPDSRDVRVPPVRSAEATSKAQPRLAFSTSFGDASPDRASMAVLEGCRHALVEAGLEVREIAPEGALLRKAWLTWGKLVGAELAPELPWWQGVGLRARRALRNEPFPLEDGLTLGRTLSAKEYLRTLNDKHEITRWVDSLLEGYDAWLCPVTMTPAFEPRLIGSPIEVDGRPVNYTAALAAFAAPFNLSGHPALVLPAGITDGGLPVGVQLVGHRWRDEQLLAAAARVQSIAGGFRPPPLTTA